MTYIITLNNKEYEVEVEQGKANIVKTTEIAVQTPAPVTVPAPEASAPPVAPAPAAPASSVGGKMVEAPMPGMILDIKVNPGTQVKKGQILLIMEAMKMENEIFSPEDGVVTQVFVTKGASVNTNDALISMQ
ncbi:MAG TPA: acetyl-CoA carboxylase biotin carboxyl carrier protein subunit [Clostridiales bacterium]|jgi:biotin carboxyl carrier protein|nr:acetyl-CoA carboxylase biotin carboxyl carrier protein subunit [Clostridiales bacterium]